MKIALAFFFGLFASASAMSATTVTYEGRCAVYRIIEPYGQLIEISVVLKPGDQTEIYNDGSYSYRVTWAKSSYFSIAIVNNATKKQYLAGAFLDQFPRQLELVPGPDMPNNLVCWYPDHTKQNKVKGKKK